MAYTDIDKSDDYFNTVLYTGDGTSSRNITGVGFQPDWVWLKQRNTTRNHPVTDSVRGANKQLYTNLTSVESTDSGTVTGFISDGFTVGSDNQANQSSGTFVSWNWLASNSTASNTDGSITSTVSANTTSGFSIVSYTGTGSNATVGHGLGVAPNMIINKCRSAAQNWATYHSSLGGTKALFLDGTDAETTSSSYFNNTDPTSSVFSVGNSGDTNKSSQTHISYCFAEKKGFSKFGSYKGNGSTDGTFVYTGFKPAFLIIKVTNTTNSWDMYDSARNPFNDVDLRVYADLANAEDSDPSIDFVSNGFKLRDTLNSNNNSSNSYIYMAFAKNPFVTSTGIPATAR